VETLNEVTPLLAGLGREKAGGGPSATQSPWVRGAGFESVWNKSHHLGLAPLSRLRRAADIYFVVFGRAPRLVVHLVFGSPHQGASTPAKPKKKKKS